ARLAVGHHSTFLGRIHGTTTFLQPRRPPPPSCRSSHHQPPHLSTQAAQPLPTGAPKSHQTTSDWGTPSRATRHRNLPNAACPSQVTTRSIPALLGLHHHPPPLPHFGSGELPLERSRVLPRLFLRARPWCLSPPPRSRDTAAAMDLRSSLLPRAHLVRAAAGSG
uniref:Uncharacterized protein n=1 Tax=Triticum urartu TaxID=4572 RepID=A0A8R7Q534_TRIUA